MKCEELRKYFPAYLDGDTSDEVAGKVGKHLKECAACRLEFERLREAVEGLRSIEELEAPPDLLVRVREKLEKESVLRRFGHFLFIPWRIKVPVEALSLVLIFVLFAYAFQFMPRKIEAPLPRREPETARLRVEGDAEKAVDYRMAAHPPVYADKESALGGPPPEAELKKEAASIPEGFAPRAPAERERVAKARLAAAPPPPATDALAEKVLVAEERLAEVQEAHPAPVKPELPARRIEKGRDLTLAEAEKGPQVPMEGRVLISRKVIKPLVEIRLAYGDREEALKTIRKLIYERGGVVVADALDVVPDTGEDVIEVAISSGAYPAFALDIEKMEGASISKEGLPGVYHRHLIKARKQAVVAQPRTDDTIYVVKEETLADADMPEYPVRMRIRLVPE